MPKRIAPFCNMEQFLVDITENPTAANTQLPEHVTFKSVPPPMTTKRNQNWYICLSTSSLDFLIFFGFCTFFEQNCSLYQTSVSKPHALALGCRPRLLGKDQVSKIK